VTVPEDYPKANATLTHPGMRGMKFEPGVIYRLKFEFSSKQDSPVREMADRGMVDAYGFRVRVAYLNKDKERARDPMNNRYDWIDMPLSPEADSGKTILALSPDPSVWSTASITFLFSRKGEYKLENVRLEKLSFR
jgi:hypothetical protein